MNNKNGILLMSILAIQSNAFGGTVSLIDDWSTSDGEIIVVNQGELLHMDGKFASGIFDVRTVVGDPMINPNPANTIAILPGSNELAINVSVGNSDPFHSVSYASSTGPVTFSALSIQFGITSPDFGTLTTNPDGYLFTLTVEDAFGASFIARNRALTGGTDVVFDLAGLGPAVDTTAITSIEFGFDGTGFTAPDFRIGPITANGLVPSPGGISAFGLVAAGMLRRRHRIEL